MDTATLTFSEAPNAGRSFAPIPLSMNICQTFKNGACDPNVDISLLRLLKSFHISCIYSNFPKDYDVFVNRIYTMDILFGAWKD